MSGFERRGNDVHGARAVAQVDDGARGGDGSRVEWERVQPRRRRVDDDRRMRTGRGDGVAIPWHGRDIAGAAKPVGERAGGDLPPSRDAKTKERYPGERQRDRGGRATRPEHERCRPLTRPHRPQAQGELEAVGIGGDADQASSTNGDRVHDPERLGVTFEAVASRCHHAPCRGR